VHDPETDTISKSADVYRQIHRQVAGVAIYPFNRARRLEVSGGIDAISYDRITTVGLFSNLTGGLLQETAVTAAAAPRVIMADTSVAFVSDTALSGPTSPILGERYRFTISPTIGSLTFATVVADYRKYVMPARPFTIAMRAMHQGRYGRDAADPRLLPLVWTLRDAVRGYGDGGVNGRNLLSATGLWVANLEARAPLMAVLGRPAQQTFIPIEGVLFSDAGAFRTPTDSGSRMFSLGSVGAGVRLNAAGMIFEFDGVRRFSSLRQGWSLAFNVRPGF
jgi:hypothetical protein